MNLAKFSGGCNTASQWVLVALFAAFPLSLALANVLMLLVLVLWALGGHWAHRWAAVKGNPVAWLALGLYGWYPLGVER